MFFTLPGCDKDQIRGYQVHRVETEPMTPAHAALGRSRMLAAIVPHGDRIWFFKVLGPEEQVGEQKEAFDQFISSIRFSDQREPPISWSVPEGWEQQPGSEMRYASFSVGSYDPPLELTVIPLGSEASSVLANVNRWRGQIGLPPIRDQELSEVTTQRDLGGVTATLVDLAGSGGSGAGAGVGQTASAAGPPMASKAAPSRSQLQYTVPNGWLENPNPRSPRVAAFQVAEGSQLAEVTVIPLPGPAGGLLSNVNRWREQIGLGPTTAEELSKELRTIEVAGSAAQAVHLVGPESAGTQRQGILGVILIRPDQTWFIKMQGPAALVAQQNSAFEAFVTSVRFGSTDRAKGDPDA
jgi:hypothetical protein